MYSAAGGLGLFLLGAIAGYLWNRESAPTAQPAVADLVEPAGHEEAENEAVESETTAKPEATAASQQPAVAAEVSVPPNEPAAVDLPPVAPGLPSDDLEADMPAVEGVENEPGADEPAADAEARRLARQFGDPLPGFGVFEQDPADDENEEPIAGPAGLDDHNLEGLEEALDDDEPEPVATHEPAVRRHPLPEHLPASDLPARLAERLPHVEFTNVPLADFLDMLGDMTRLPITFDLAAVRASSARLGGLISIGRTDVSVAELLTEAVSQQNLTYRTEGEQVIVTTAAAPRSFAYPYTDLAPEQEGPQFAVLLQNMVAPHTWRAASGAGTISVRGESLDISQTPAVHSELVEFCEKLRVARGLPLRSRYGADRFQLATRCEQAAKLLQQPLGYTYFRPTRLVEVARFLEEASGADVYLDWQSLSSEEFSPDSEISCAIEEQPLGEGLDALLEPLKLAWRLVDANTLEIYAQGDAARKMEIEFYPLAPLLSAGLKHDDVLASIYARTRETSWQAGGGGGLAYYDPIAQTLVIRQTTAVHRTIAKLLEGLASE